MTFLRAESGGSGVHRGARIGGKVILRGQQRRNVRRQAGLVPKSGDRHGGNPWDKNIPERALILGVICRSIKGTP